MFGYVTVPKNLLTEEEYSVFRAYYCGLCKATGKCASQISRLGLSYDITFLALVLSSLCNLGETKKSRCIIHPVKEFDVVFSDSAVNYSARAGVLLNYLKLADDWKDEKSLKSLCAMPALFFGYKRAFKGMSKQAEIINNQLKLLSRLEKENCTSIDETADAFAKITEALFTPEFITDEGQRRTLAWLGYNLGRWIYIIDAFDDFDEDLKNKSYNPLILSGNSSREECSLTIEESLIFTLENIASAFELLDFNKNKDIIGKIIYIGLKQKQELILHPKKSDEKPRKGIV